MPSVAIPKSPGQALRGSLPPALTIPFDDSSSSSAAAPPSPRSSTDDRPEEEDHGPSTKPKPPSSSPDHNNNPISAFTNPLQAAVGGRTQKFKPGHRWDLERSLTPTICPRVSPETASRWVAMASETHNPGPPRSASTIIPQQEWLAHHARDLDGAWIPMPEKAHSTDSAKQQKLPWNRLERALMRSPVMPLVLRLLVWVFSLVALVLGASIYKQGARGGGDGDGGRSYTSPEMAIIVDAVALVYLVYIAWDEYMGKQVGLRSPKAKLRLILLDLVFIVFDSANLALAFESLYAAGPGGAANAQQLTGSAPAVPVVNTIAAQRALASVLLLALVGWLMTFSISVLRIVERVTT